MSKKSKRRASRFSPKTVALTPADREQKAREALAGGRYREAITGFKELLKLEPRPELQAALADAYAGRARELAAKDMVKEALVMWENRAALGLDAGIHPEHASLLLQTGGIERLLKLFAGGTALAPADRERLRPLLAARAIAGDEQVAGMLADDDPVRRHAQPARDALAAYCSGDDQALQTALATIPFRSPYRDWVQLLKALQQAEGRPKEARALLARIDDDSAFAPLRRAAEIALLPERAFLEALGKAGEATLRFACALRGWPPERVALHRELAQVQVETKPRALLRLLFRHRAALGDDWVRRQALRLLVDDFPERLAWLDHEQTGELTQEEYHQVAAWSVSVRQEPWDGVHHWNLLARHLMGHAPPDGDDALHRLRIATALRAVEFGCDLLSDQEPSDDPEDLDRLVAAQLEQSLEYDPDHRDSYLRLIDYYRRGNRLKDVRRLLAQASARWPKDMPILGAALDTALDSGAYKKAAAIAREMLEVDSINTDVRGRLVDAHLAHAHKQLKQGRRDLARKELATAAEWARGSHARERIDLTSGLISLSEDGARGAAELLATAARIGGGLTGRIALALAADGAGMTQAALQRQAKLPKPASGGRDDLLAALARLRNHLDRGGDKSPDLIGWLDQTFSATAWKVLDRAELEAACDTLRRYGLHKSRRGAAEAALKRWKHAPIFELHAFEAKYPDGFTGYSDAPLIRLERAMERARADGDTRTARRIESALHALNPFAGLPPRGFPQPPSMPPDLDLDDALSGTRDLGALAALVRLLGIEKVFDILGLPPDLRRELKKVKRQIGEEAMTESLLEFLGMQPDLADDEIDLPLPKPRRRRANR